MYPFKCKEWNKDVHFIWHFCFYIFEDICCEEMFNICGVFLLEKLLTEKRQKTIWKQYKC